MSGELMSSLGGLYPSTCPEVSFLFTRRDHGLCLHGKRTRRSLCRTYEFETLKLCKRCETGRCRVTWMYERRGE